jgi:hypothetical protein
MAWVTNGCTVVPVKSWASVKVDMIIGARLFQIGLPSSTVSYCSIEESGFAIAGRASVFCSRELRATVAS